MPYDAMENDPKIKKDIEVLGRFIQIYCDGKHSHASKHRPVSKGKVEAYISPLDLNLCEECSALIVYAAGMRIICPYDPKPRCKKCVTHCYMPKYRALIREVMAYSGKELIKKGKLGLLWKYLF